MPRSDALCILPGCRRGRGLGTPTCTKHWAKVPRQIQLDHYIAYTNRDRPAQLAAGRAAVAYLTGRTRNGADATV
ncbi:MAG TPA: hypothetical protein VGJ54_16910 [Streptosporangiaceae bacterium]